MSVDKLLPVVRDLVFLAAGTTVFVREAFAGARWGPMILGMAVAAGPTLVSAVVSAVVSAHWSGARTPDSPPSPSSPPSSPSSSSPSPSS